MRTSMLTPTASSSTESDSQNRCTPRGWRKLEPQPQIPDPRSHESGSHGNVAIAPLRLQISWVPTSQSLSGCETQREGSIYNVSAMCGIPVS